MAGTPELAIDIGEQHSRTRDASLVTPTQPRKADISRPYLIPLPPQGESVSEQGVVLFPLRLDSPEARPVVRLAQSDRSNSMLHREHWAKDLANPEDAVSVADKRLKELGAPKKLRNKLFDRDGRFRHKDKSGADILNATPDDAFNHIVRTIEPELEAIEYYLDRPTTSDRPYNAHGEEHLRSVHMRSQELLRNSGHIGRHAQFRKREFQYDQDLLGPDKIARYAAIISGIHDLGYLVDPDHHPIVSTYLAEDIFPQFQSNPQEWAEIRRGVWLHEGDNFRTMLTNAGVTTHAEAIDVLAKEYPYVPAVMLADKLDQTKERVRGDDVLRTKSKHVDPITFLDDPHVEIHLLTEIKHAGWTGETFDRRAGGPVTTFRVETDFTQGMDAEDVQVYPYFAVRRSSRPGFKFGVSERTKSDYQEHGKKYFESLVERNLEVAAFRMIDSAICSFALNPEQDKAEFVFTDTENKKEIRFPFYRATIDEDIQNFWDAHVPPSIQRKRGPDELKI